MRDPPPFLPPGRPTEVEESQTSISRAPPEKNELESERVQIVQFARESLGRKRIESDGRPFQDDCTGLVLAAYSHVGVRLFTQAKPGDNGVAAIYRYVQSHGRVFRTDNPSPGDLVFFRDTYDLNRDGRANDGLTHVGIVESINTDATVSIIHRVSRGVVRYRMNLGRPGIHRDAKSGDILNDYLRAPGPQSKVALTGELFAGYGSIFARTSARVAKSQEPSAGKPPKAHRDGEVHRYEIVRDQNDSLQRARH